MFNEVQYDEVYYYLFINYLLHCSRAVTETRIMHRLGTQYFAYLKGQSSEILIPFYDIYG
jgi:hypothetical protein